MVTEDRPLTKLSHWSAYRADVPTEVPIACTTSPPHSPSHSSPQSPTPPSHLPPSLQPLSLEVDSNSPTDDQTNNQTDNQTNNQTDNLTNQESVLVTKP